MSSSVAGRLVAWACALAVTATCFAWIVANPLPSYWDEALYANSVISDVASATTRGARGFLDAYWNVDPLRPPAERLMAFPFALLFGPRLFLLRALSILGFVIAAFWLAACAGRDARDLTLLFVLASPVLVLSAKMFGTEYAVFLALAGTVWCLTAQPRRWIILGICIGVGALAKVSYLFCAGPMIFVALIGAGRWPSIARPRDVAKALLLGGAIAATWWIRDGMIALRTAAFAGATFDRHSLGSWASPATFARYAYELARCGLGFGVAACAVVACWLARSSKSATLAILAAGAFPLILSSYFSRNHNPRLIAPAIFLIAAMVAIIIASRPRLARAAFVIAVVQIVVMIFPRPWSDENRSYIWRGTSEVMAPVEQWDWSRLRELADRRGLHVPVVALKGEGYAMNVQQIIYGWASARRPVHVMLLVQPPPVSIERAAKFAQIVVTAPGYRGEASDGQIPFNRDNDAFAALVSHDPRFTGPVRLDLGIDKPAVVSVFFKR